MIKPGNGGYNIGGDCEKGSGSRYCLGLCLARVREIWQIGRVVERGFSRSGVYSGLMIMVRKAQK